MTLTHTCLIVQDLLTVHRLHRPEGHVANLGEDVLIDLTSMIIKGAFGHVGLIDLQGLFGPCPDRHVPGVDDATILHIVLFEDILLHQLLFGVSSYLVSLPVYGKSFPVFELFRHDSLLSNASTISD